MFSPRLMSLGSVLLLLCLSYASVSVANDAQQPFLHSSHSQDGPRTAAKHAITPGLSAFVDSLLEVAQIPGISLGVVRLNDGEPIIELGAWGRQTEESGINDLTPGALFDIASCSKSFLATSVGLLMDDFANGHNVTPLPPGVSRFDWDTKIRDLLPDDWKLEDEWASEKANVRDILSHVSGLPRHDFSYRPGDTLRESVKNLRNLPPAYELRERWSYNNIMYMVGAYIVTKYADTPYTSFASSRIFAPLNMASTTFWPAEAAQSGRLTQTWTKFGRRLPSGFSNDSVELMAGPGGVISSAEDLAKWVIVHLNQGVDPASNKTMIPRFVFYETTTAHVVYSGKPLNPELSIHGYGLGWGRYSYRGYDIVTHDGGIPGISTRVAFLPANGLGVIVLANADEKAEANQLLVDRIIDNMFDLPHIERKIGVDASGAAVYLDDVQETSGGQKEATTADARQAPDLEAYAGTYNNTGYGSITLCAPASDSYYCNAVHEDFAPFRNTSSFGDEDLTLYAAFPRIWSTHVRMTYHQEETFGVKLTALFPHGYGGDLNAFETAETGESKATAVFVVEGEETRKVKGFGLLIHDFAVEGRRRNGVSDVQEYADAWFEKVY